NAVHKVSGISAPARFIVQGHAGFHVMRNVGDVDEQLPMTARCAFETNRVIEIFRVIRIDRNHWIPPAILTSAQFFRPNLRTDLAGFSESFLREAERE